MEIVPSLRWLIEEALSDSGRSDFFLQAILNKFLQMERKNQAFTRDSQEKFMVEVTKTYVLHNRELRENLKKYAEKYAEPVMSSPLLK